MRLFLFLLAALCFALAPILALAQFPASASASPGFAEKISLNGIHDAGKVSDQLFRGAQPTLSSLPQLQTLGVTTIVDLRRESPQTREKERHRAESLGLRFVHIPVGGFSNPTSAQLAQFFSLFRETPPQKIFVHCEYGEDRTGVFIASYRIAFQQWTAEQALAEMYAFGFRGFWHPAMITFVRAFPARLQSDPTLKAALSAP
jgi:protein tyrosine/serine phosphatase